MIPLLLLACNGSIESDTSDPIHTNYSQASLVAHTNAAAPNSIVFTMNPPIADTLSCESTSVSTERHRLQTSEASPEITLFGLLANHTYTCVLEAHEAQYSTQVTTPTLPQDLPDMTLTASRAQETYTLMHYGDRLKATQKVLIVVDPMGEIRWFFRPAHPTFMDVDASFTEEGHIHFGGGGGGLDLLDQTATAPQTIDLSGNVLSAVPITGDASFHHHAQSVGANQSTALIYAPNVIENEDVHGSELLHFDLATGEIIWSWNTQQAIDSAAIDLDLSILPNAIHPNWVQKRKEDYLISLFHNESVISVSNVTGEVKWRIGMDGDFLLHESDGSVANTQRWFRGIHGADFSGDSLLVYDNLHSPNNDTDYFSRVVRVALDETNMHATITGEYTEPGWIEPILGSVEAIGGDDILVGMGHCLACESLDNMPVGKNHHSAVVRLDLTTGKPWWRLDFIDANAIIYGATQTDACLFLPTNQRYCLP